MQSARKNAAAASVEHQLNCAFPQNKIKEDFYCVFKSATKSAEAKRKSISHDGCWGKAGLMALAIASCRSGFALEPRSGLGSLRLPTLSRPPLCPLSVRQLYHHSGLLSIQNRLPLQPILDAPPEPPPIVRQPRRWSWPVVTCTRVNTRRARGQGKYTWADGAFLEGLWANGKKVGPHKGFEADGSAFEEMH